MSGRGTQHIKFSRREIIALAASLSAGALIYKYSTNQKNNALPKLIRDENSKRGHLLREEFVIGELATSTDCEIAIVGSGISGLSTAYFLEKQNQKKYKIFEADKRIGGNSASGENDISKFPLGAHYLPIVRNDDSELISFLNEIGVITGFKNNLPVYKEEFLCGAPHERLFIKGRWQESIIPQFAAGYSEISEISNFLEFVNKLRTQKGSDGKYLFSIPVDSSSQDQEWLKLDKITFRNFLDSKNWKSEYLNWYVNYCCRDDFGLNANETSAWAGLHYFASRSGIASNAEAQSVLTWPEGNGYLVEQLKNRISNPVQTECTVRRIIDKKGYFQLYYSDHELKTHEVKCKNVVYAVPKSVVKKIQPEIEFPFTARAQPWLLSNIKIKKEALEDRSSLCWDNVRFSSESLGYINSSQQVLAQGDDFVNITFYHAFAAGTPVEERKKLSQLTEQDLYKLTMQELTQMHPALNGAIEEIQFKLIGHGMIGPDVDYLWNRRLQNQKAEPKNLIFAHTERAGISIFEEAFHQGRLAAKRLRET